MSEEMRDAASLIRWAARWHNEHDTHLSDFPVAFLDGLAKRIETGEVTPPAPHPQDGTEALRARIEALEAANESLRRIVRNDVLSVPELHLRGALLAAAPAPTGAPGSEWVGPLLACTEPGRDGFWSYQECPRGVTGMAAHRRLGLVHRLRADDRRHACEDVIHPAISTSHHKSVAVEDTTADLAPTEAGEGE